MSKKEYVGFSSSDVAIRKAVVHHAIKILGYGSGYDLFHDFILRFVLVFCVGGPVYNFLFLLKGMMNMIRRLLFSSCI